jgi:DNA-binding Lrp family transcriptional regulator
MAVAYMLVITEMGEEHDVAKEISKIEGVDDVTITYGAWDLVIKVLADSLPALDGVVTEIRRLPFVKETMTLIGK